MSEYLNEWLNVEEAKKMINDFFDSMNEQEPEWKDKYSDEHKGRLGTAYFYKRGREDEQKDRANS